VLAADEPVEVGGTDTGPGPYDLLLASLGGPAGLTAYARSLGDNRIARGWK